MRVVEDESLRVEAVGINTDLEQTILQNIFSSLIADHKDWQVEVNTFIEWDRTCRCEVAMEFIGEGYPDPEDYDLLLNELELILVKYGDKETFEIDDDSDRYFIITFDLE